MYPALWEHNPDAVRQITSELLSLDRHAEVLQHRIEAVRLHWHVVLQHSQMGKFLNNIRGSLARARQAPEDQSYGSGAVMRQMQFRNRHAAAAFAAENCVVFDHAFGDVCLSDLSAHN